MNVTAFDIAQRFVGVKELPGDKDNPFILSMLQLDTNWPLHDEVPWCSAFVNYVAWLLRLPRSKNLGARSWLTVGMAVGTIAAPAVPGFDVVVLERGVPGSQGHVGFLASPGFMGQGMMDVMAKIHVLGGNQGNSVSVEEFPQSRVLGVRRLWTPGR